MDDEEEGEGKPSAKTVKSDYSKVPVHLWNDCIAQKLTVYLKEEGVSDKIWDLEEKEEWENLDHFCDLLCKGMLKFWKNKVKKYFWEWYEEKDKCHKDPEAVLSAGKEAICRA